jgi:hypothetical protein
MKRHYTRRQYKQIITYGETCRNLELILAMLVIVGGRDAGGVALPAGSS